MKLTVSESVIENQILTWLFYKKIFAWKNVTGGFYDRKRGTFRRQQSKFAINGVPDILGILNDGRFLAIEVKSKTGKLSEDQKAWIERAEKNKALCIVARSVRDVEEILK